MISMMELMEKKTPLTKDIDKKKGMTLVEVMAAMAILSILFVGISGLIINIAKSEDISNTLLDNTTKIKAIMTMFEVNSDGNSQNEYISKSRFEELKAISPIILEFDEIENLQEQIVSGVSGVGNKYKTVIEISKDSNKSLYRIVVKLENTIKNQELTKEIYINRN